LRVPDLEFKETTKSAGFSTRRGGPKSKALPRAKRKKTGGRKHVFYVTALGPAGGNEAERGRLGSRGHDKRSGGRRELGGGGGGKVSPLCKNSKRVGPWRELLGSLRGKRFEEGWN